MSALSISQFFSALGADLHNTRWSWGAERIRGPQEEDAIVLRVWQDRCRMHEGTRYVMLTHMQKYGGDPSDLGYNERLTHVERIREGATCYMVMCRVKDPDAPTREILWSKPPEFIFVGGELRQLDNDGDWWIALKEKVPAYALIQEAKQLRG